MQEVILVIHLILTVSLVVMVLIQRSEGGALGIGGGQGGMSSGLSSVNMMTKVTALLAVGFVATSLVLAVIAKNQAEDSSIFDKPAKVIEQPVPEDNNEPVIPDN